MSLKDVTGVFSRYFVVGFFMPAYISLVLLWLTASSEFIPDSLEDHSQGTELLILGGVALVVAMALSGTTTTITRLFQGLWPPELMWWPLRSNELRRFHRLVKIRDHDPDPGTRTDAEWAFDSNFPGDELAVLPTRVGNIMRASEWHSYRRWGLDGATVWPRVEALLSDGERELLLNAKIDFYVLVNATLGASVVGVLLIVDSAINDGGLTWWQWPLYIVPFLIAYLLYRAAQWPARQWGGSVRSGVDLHRFEVYEKLGFRTPTSFSDERNLAREVNKVLAYGETTPPDDLWGHAAKSDPEKDDEALL
jgi:hypothetical protein